MITTVTLNPMVDKTVRVQSLTRGAIHRAHRMGMVAGGKGINVSRQLSKLGMKTLATGFLGGETGVMVKKLLGEEGIDHDFVMTPVLTREGVTYVEADGTTTAVFEPSAPVPGDSIQALKVKLETLARRSAWMVLSGSSPVPETDGMFYHGVTVAKNSGIRSVLDSYGTALKQGLNAIPTLVKPNKQEYALTFGVTLSDEGTIRGAMDLWLTAGIEYVLITDGAEPFYAATRKGKWKITCPKVESVNPVGSGDAMVAGMLFGLENGWDVERCLAFGAAAGAANARKWEVGNSTLEEIKGLAGNVVIKRLE